MKHFSLILTLCASLFLFESRVKAAEISFEKDSALPLVYINVAIKTGYVSDPKGQSGLTNFMGEMLLRGTQKQTKEQIDLALDQMGGKLEVETRLESLIFRGAILSSQLQPFLNLMAEILTQPTFPQVEIGKLKSELVSVLKEELGNDPALASKFFYEFLFQGHPYGNSALGKIKDIQNLSQENIYNHYNRLVRDALILVIGTGDASPKIFENWGQNIVNIRNKSLKSLPAGNDSLVGLVASEEPKNFKHRRLLIVNKPDRTQTQIHLGEIGIKMQDKNYFPLYLGNYAFGGPSFSATLMTEIRVKRGWSYGANSAFRHGLQPRSWNIHLFPASKDTAAALAYTLKLTEDLRNKGITADQFQFAQKSLINSSGFMYNTARKRVENALIEKTIHLPEGFMRSYASHLKGLTLEDVNSSLKSFVKPDQLSIVVLATAQQLKGPLTQAAGVSVDQVEVVPYTQD